MSDAAFHQLHDTGLIKLEGADAVPFLHAQLTSDIAGLPVLRTQYSGYCSPKGRLLATFLVWRLPDCMFLQLPRALTSSIAARLAKYVLRAKVTIADASPQWTLFGVSGPDAAAVLEPLNDGRLIPPATIVAASDVAIAHLAPARYLILASASQAPAVRAVLNTIAAEQSEARWAQLDIDAGVPWITPATQDEYVPQMVNLDLIGAVSYSKGCYPGQEIVARTHYLGRVKQRLRHVRLRGEGSAGPGDRLYGAHFGPEQASGTLLNTVPHPEDGDHALAVIHSAAISAGTLHWKSLEGPAVEFLPLPYAVPEAA